MAESGSSFRDSVNRMFDRAVAVLDLPKGLPDEIKACNSVLKLEFPVLLRGEYKIFCGWRAVHSEHRRASPTFPAFASSKTVRACSRPIATC